MKQRVGYVLGREKWVNEGGGMIALARVRTQGYMFNYTGAIHQQDDQVESKD